MNSRTLAGKTALVTGASGGIGAAISRALASAGASVALHYHSGSERAEELAVELKLMGVRAVALRADLCEASEIESLFDRAEAELGSLDILVNNAGVGTTGTLADTDVEKLDRLIAVNFRAVALALRQAATRLREGGTVINISSMLGDHPLPGTTTYAATKAAVDLLSRGAAREFGERRISVKSVSPGATLPGMFGESPKERQDALAAETPLGRLGRAEDIAAMVAFLASEPGRWINGTVVTADGGYSA
jgi:3-oxoacyl-[acyl-carrier protein] reductase